MDIKDIMSLPHTTSIKPELATVRSAATPKARSASQDLDGQRPPKRSRKAINCDPCRASKLKCDRGRPCSGCVLRGTTAQCYPDSTSNEHSTPAHISSVDTVDLHTGDPYAEIARMRQSLAALEAQLARHGITPPGNSNSSLVPAASVSNGGGTNGHISPSQISSTPTNEGESTSSPPAMEAGMYVGPTSAASPLLSFRVGRR
ncbi:hypothetical protein FRC12_000043 [Ceratobasidium sp. 428]|nr:hypothetical protein FRC12_000043 [Ceratobasidium sp. 428]